MHNTQIQITLRMSYLETKTIFKTQVIVQKNFVVVHKRIKQNGSVLSSIRPEIVMENWTGSSGHERHLPTGVGILS